MQTSCYRFLLQLKLFYLIFDNSWNSSFIIHSPCCESSLICLMHFYDNLRHDCLLMLLAYFKKHFTGGIIHKTRFQFILLKTLNKRLLMTNVDKSCENSKLNACRDLWMILSSKATVSPWSEQLINEFFLFVFTLICFSFSTVQNNSAVVFDANNKQTRKWNSNNQNINDKFSSNKPIISLIFLKEKINSLFITQLGTKEIIKK